MKRARFFSSIFALMLFLGCLKFYAFSPFYVMADLFYYMPRSAFDDYDGLGAQGMVWFPATRLNHLFECS